MAKKTKKATKKQKIEATKSDLRTRLRPYRKNGGYVVCGVCKKLFYVPKCRLKTAKYCSFSCHGVAESRKKWANHVPRKVTCLGCGEEKKHHSRGFCHRCYNKFIWNNNPRKKEYDEIYYLENIEKIKRRTRNYGKTEIGKLIKRKNYFNRGGKSQYDLRELKKATNYNFIKFGGAYYCERCISPIGNKNHWIYHIDHIIPLTKNGTSKSENLQLLCPSCNYKKHTEIADYRFRELNV
jgi:5-methylcytosine-specific restriction endonuclease McrA